MHRFFINSAFPNQITGEEHMHLARVLRLRVGDQVELLADDGIALAEIVQVGKDATSVRNIKILPSREAYTRVTLYIGMLKGEKMDFLAQKAVELGAYALQPLLMRYSIAKECKIERLSRIAREAQKQCGRAHGLFINEPLPFMQALNSMCGHTRLIASYEGGGIMLTTALFSSGIPKAQSIGLVIGPEGGIDAEEIAALRAIDAHIVTLGPRILRAETAAIATLAVTMALAGEWS